MADKSEVSAYIETSYEIMDDMYFDGYGIARMSQLTDGTPICFFGGYQNTLYERIWGETGCIRNKYTLNDEMMESEFQDGWIMIIFIIASVLIRYVF